VIPVVVIDGAATWFGAWLLDRLLREVEDRASAPLPTASFDCRCIWCNAMHVVERPVGAGPPTEPPPGWLESRRWPGFYWCSLRCWSEAFRDDAGHGYPAGDDWDASLEIGDDL
jgi:hypothetical protein